MVLVTVLMVVIVISFVAAATLSLNLSQSNSARSQVDQIVAQEFAQGAFWKTYADANSGIIASVPDESLNGKVFTATLPANPASHTESQVLTVNY